MPVALNLYKVREDKGPAGDFFRSVQKQKPNYQGLWVATPEGKVLSAHQDMKTMNDPRGKWTQSALADLQAGLKAFGPVEPRRRVEKFQSLPNRGMGTFPDGRVNLAVTDRWVFVKDLSRDPPRDALGPTVFDSIVLTTDEWKKLGPADTRSGTAWEVPEAVARKFYPVLSASDTVFRDPKEITSVRLAGQVETVEGGVAYLVYTGAISGTHIGTRNEGKEGKPCISAVKLLGGVGTLDVKSGKMLSLTLVFDGSYRNYPPYDHPARFGAVVEWTQEPGKR
ncbi:MAG: hypothetical protein U0840_26555 [Gemmataceae bacterium]